MRILVTYSCSEFNSHNWSTHNIVLQTKTFRIFWIFSDLYSKWSKKKCYTLYQDLIVHNVSIHIAIYKQKVILFLPILWWLSDKNNFHIRYILSILGEKILKFAWCAEVNSFTNSFIGTKGTLNTTNITYITSYGTYITYIHSWYDMITTMIDKF